MAQRWKYTQHSLAQDFCALADGVRCFRKECGPPPKQHAAVRRDAEVMQEILRIINHSVARTEMASQVLRERLCDNDVGADRDNSLAQRWSRTSGVSARRHEDIARPELSARCDEVKPVHTGSCPPLHTLHACLLVQGSTGSFIGPRQSRHVLRRVHASTRFVDPPAVIDFGTDFAREFAPRDNPHLVLKVPGEPFRRTSEFIKMRPLACNDQVPAADEVTVNSFFADDSLDAIN